MRVKKGRRREEEREKATLKNALSVLCSMGGWREMGLEGCEAV